MEQRGGVLQLRLDVDRLVAVDRVLDRRQVELAGRGGGEPRVAVGRPLHRRTHSVAVAEPDVVAHPDLVAVVEDGRAGQRQQERGEELHPVDVVVEQRREPAADADVGLHPRVVGVLRPHVVAVLVGHHLEGELVVVAQEDAPLAAVGDRRGLLEDLRDREARLAAHRHEDARHDGEVEGHVALGADPPAVLGLLGTEVLHDVGRPLVGLAEQHAPGVVLVDEATALLEEVVRLGEVLAVGAGALVEVRHRVEPEPVEAHVEPEGHRLQHRVVDLGVVEVEVRLVVEEPVPEVLLAHRVPRPVGRLGVDEDDAGVLVELVGVGPDVEVAVGTLGVAAAGLEPRVGVARVVHDEVDDHADAALVAGVEELVEVLDRAALGEDVVVVGDVVAAVAQGRGEERRDPQAVHAQPLEVVELLDQALEVAGPVAVGVAERPDQHLVEDRRAEPVGLRVEHGGRARRVRRHLGRGGVVGQRVLLTAITWAGS